MKKMLFTFTILGLGILTYAQDKPYASTENKHYWKNRMPFAGYWQQDVDYTIKAKLDDKTDIVTGSETLIYTNNSPDTLYVVYFHLYQNAFVDGSYLEQLNLSNDYKQKFGPYEAQGKGTTLSKLIVDIGGEKTEQNFIETDSAFWAANPDLAQVKGDFSKQELANFYYSRLKPIDGVPQLKVKFDNTIMRLTLPKPILPGAQATFQIEFKTYFDDGGDQRRRMKLFKDAWGNKQYDGVHWYPRMCVYDRKFGWATDQHLGKEFYGDYGKYNVELTLPSQYILDATGVLQNQEEVMPQFLRAKLDIHNFKEKLLDSPPSEIIKADGSFKTWKFISINTHDFAWVADPTFRIGEVITTLNNGEKVSCIALAQEPHASRWQDAADFTSKVIDTYSKDIGNYVYPKMIVADARDGMEYPMLTLDGGLSPGYYGLFAHEVGHNWFFGMVGNNETYRACLDEGFTQFLTNWCMTSIFGEIKATKKNPHPVSRMDQTVYYGYLRDAMKHEDMPLNTHSDDFNGALNHGGGYGHVYYKTATMLYNLQYVLGDTLFLAAMQHYFDQWKMAHPYIEDFRNSIIQFTRVDLNWFFDQWFETTKTIDYRIDYYTKENSNDFPFQKYNIIFRRGGEMQMPIDFTVFGKDSGQVYNYHIPNTYFIKELKPKTKVLRTWKGWSNLNETYQAQIVLPKEVSIKKIQIDPTYRLADIYQPDNATGVDAYLVFDKGRRLPFDRKRYVWEWRPDIWYNSIDGVKAGAHIEGNFMNYRDVFKASVWYNTGLGNDYIGTTNRKVDYTLSYRNGHMKGTQTYIELRELDGVVYEKLGLSLSRRKSVVDMYLKVLERPYKTDLDYLLYPADWKSGMFNISLNVDWARTYNQNGSSGELKESFRTTIGGRDNAYSYARFAIQWIHHQKIGQTALHSRLLISMMEGSKIAPESQLMLAGANPEEMMESKFLRSRAFVPTDWLTMGGNYNHFQAGGGLNIRGYAGYMVPRNVNGGQVYMYKGNTGASINLEYDLDGLIRFTPKKVSNYLHLNTYLFTDGGILESKFSASEYGLTKDATLNTGLMISAGAGCALTIKKWGNMDKAKPLTLRLDLPMFLSNSPYVDGQYMRLRWMAGISRSF